MMKTLLLLMACLGLAYCAVGLDDILRVATDIAGALGTQNSGVIPRSNGCFINWSYQGMIKGLEWKYMGVCTDSCTKEVETVFTKSRGGAVEHCLKNLLTRVAAKVEL